jgi:hypothetical protein
MQNIPLASFPHSSNPPVTALKMLARPDEGRARFGAGRARPDEVQERSRRASFSAAHFRILIATPSRLEAPSNSINAKEKTFSNRNKKRAFMARFFARHSTLTTRHFLSLFTFPFSTPADGILLGGRRPGMVVFQIAPATGAFPSDFTALRHDSPCGGVAAGTSGKDR